MGCGSVFGKVHCQIIETVSVNTSSGWQVVDRIDVDVDHIFVELVGSGCTVHNLGFSRMVLFGCALQKTEVLNGCWVADGA